MKAPASPEPGPGPGDDQVETLVLPADPAKPGPEDEEVKSSDNEGPLTASPLATRLTGAPGQAKEVPRTAFEVGRAAADTPDGFDVDAAVQFFCLHPKSRLCVVLFIFCANCFVNAEDPIAHSRKEATMPLIGAAIALVSTAFPTDEAALMVAKAICFFVPLIVGAWLGRRLLHHHLFRDRYQLPLFAGEGGTWLVMLLSGMLACVVIGAPTYNRVVDIVISDSAERDSLHVGNSLNFSEESLGVATALSTFMLDFFMGMAVLDLMLQDERHYPHSLTRLRGLYSGRKRLVAYYSLWVIAVGLVYWMVLVPVLSTGVAAWWDDFNYDFLPSTEYTRGFIVSFVVLFDAVVVAQDWDFQSFTSPAGVKLPGLNVCELRFQLPLVNRLKCLRRHKFADVVITHKWYCYFSVFVVMMFDLNQMKNQLIYNPADFGQYTGPQGHIYSTPSAAANNASTPLSYAERCGPIDDDGSCRFDDVVLAARYHDSSVAWKLMACCPAAAGVLLFIFLTSTAGEGKVWSQRRKHSIHALHDNFAAETRRRSVVLPALGSATVAVDADDDGFDELDKDTAGGGYKLPVATVQPMGAAYRSPGGGQQHHKNKPALAAADESALSLRMRTLKWVTFMMCDDPSSSKTATVIHAWLTFVVLASISAFCAQTLDTERYNMPDAKFWWTLELFFSLVFTIEVGVRFLVSESHWTRMADSTAVPFFHDVLNWFDMAAILPFYLELVTVGMPNDDETTNDSDTALDLVRLLRVARIFKVMRNFNGWSVILRAGKASMVPLVLPIFFLFLFSMIFATTLFWVEPCDDGDEECPFTDVFNAGYYVIVTMTTVGYGDQIPKSSVGRGLAVVCMMFGACFMAMPLAIIGHNFEQAWTEEQDVAKMLDDVESEGAAKRNKALGDLTVREDEAPFPKLQRLLPLAMQQYFGVSHSIAALSSQLERLQEFMTAIDNATEGDVGGPNDPSMLRAKAERAQDTMVPAVNALVQQHREFVDTFQSLLSPYFKPKSLKGGEIVRPNHLRQMTISTEKMRAQAASTEAYSMDDVDAAINSGKLSDKVWLMMEVPGSSRAADRVSTFIMVSVCSSIFIFCMQTVPELADVEDELTVMQYIFVAVFTVEFLVRLVVCPSMRKFWKEPTNWVDFLSVLPFYVEVALEWNAGSGGSSSGSDDDDGDDDGSRSNYEALRLLAVIRVFKILRHFSGTEVLVETARQCYKRLVVPLFVFSLSTVLFGSLVYTFEKGDRILEEVQYSSPCGSYLNETCTFNSTEWSSERYGTDGEESPFRDLFNAAWLIVVTMTTVGYGGITPITPLGKGVAMVAMLFGTFYLAMPLTIVGNIFVKLFVTDARARENEKAAMQLVLDLEHHERADPLYARRRETLHNLFVFFSSDGPEYDNQSVDKADLTEVMVFSGDVQPGLKPSIEKREEFLAKMGVTGNGRIMEPQFVKYCLLTMASRISPELDATKGTGDWSAFDEYIEGYLNHYCKRPLLQVSPQELRLWDQYLNDTLAHLGKLQLVCSPPLFKTAIAVCYELLARVQQLHANYAVVMERSVFPKLTYINNEMSKKKPLLIKKTKA